MKSTILIIIALLLAATSFAQVYPGKYFIRFTDKDNSPYSIDNPSEFLSQRALDRRAAQDISVDETDLPVNPAYLQGVAALGADLLNPSRWLNGVTIAASDPSIIEEILALPYVAGVVKSAGASPEGDLNPDKFRLETEIANPAPMVFSRHQKRSTSLNYGDAYNQIHMLNGDLLHDMGYKGEGMVIAVLDAGFWNANVHPAFDSLWQNGQILGDWDFVEGGPLSYDEHFHGTMVLSCIGANVPGSMIGTAPEASFYLLRSEDGDTEYIIEEYNWVSAAEYADSVGADMINSSLGYTTFNDPSQDHTYADMDGDTAPVTIGADMAAKKGILVCNSLGNEGSSSWYYLAAPSDGDSVVGVGAVDAGGFYASFSSHGPSSDGRVKPDLMAQGSSSVVADPWGGGFSYGSGTSFASPILAGALACLWQANPGQSNMQVLEAARQSASHYNNPTPEMGFGIPDLMMANNILTVIESHVADAFDLSLFPNPFRDALMVGIENAPQGSGAILRVIDAAGRVILKMEVRGGQAVINDLAGIAPGYYTACVETGKQQVTRKLLKY